MVPVHVHCQAGAARSLHSTLCAGIVSPCVVLDDTIRAQKQGQLGHLWHFFNCTLMKNSIKNITSNLLFKKKRS